MANTTKKTMENKRTVSNTYRKQLFPSRKGRHLRFVKVEYLRLKLRNYGFIVVLFQPILNYVIL